jgi:hypothetical protein
MPKMRQIHPCRHHTEKQRLPYCGTKVNLQKAQRIAAAENAFEAQKYLKHLKAERGFDR